MPDPFSSLPLLFAQNPPAGNSGSPYTYLPFVLLVVVYGYFLLIRPQQQQEKKRREMLAALKKNDKVLTAAGIYGTVVSIDGDGDRVVLRVDDDRGIKIAFSKTAISRVLDGAQVKEKAEEVA